MVALLGVVLMEETVSNMSHTVSGFKSQPL